MTLILDQRLSNTPNTYSVYVQLNKLENKMIDTNTLAKQNVKSYPATPSKVSNPVKQDKPVNGSGASPQGQDVINKYIKRGR